MKLNKYVNIGLVLLAAFACVLFSDPVLQASGITMAVVGGMFTTSTHAFRVNLQKKVGKEAWIYGRLGPLTSIIDYEKYKATGQLGVVPGSPALDASIIRLVRDFKSNKGVKLDVPLTRPLTGQGRTGTATLTNNAERKKLFYQKVAINMKRHALQVRDNEMSEQMLPAEIAMEIMERDGSDLKDWFSRYLSFENLYALLTGYSTNLWDPSWGLGYDQKSHPNIYIGGHGEVDFNTTSGAHTARTFDAGWEVNLATLITAMAEADDTALNMNMVRTISFMAQKKKLQGLKSNKYQVPIAFITSAHVRQLRKDPEFIEIMNFAAERGKDNPLFTGQVESYLIEGVLFVVDDTIPSIFVTSDTEFSTSLSTNGLSTGLQYGTATFMDNPRDGGYRKPILVVGAGAILAAEGAGFKLTEEVTDHEQSIESGGRMIYGMTRSDMTDDDNYLGNGAGKFYANTDSFEVVTYTPDTI